MGDNIAHKHFPSSWECCPEAPVFLVWLEKGNGWFPCSKYKSTVLTLQSTNQYRVVTIAEEVSSSTLGRQQGATLFPW